MSSSSSSPLQVPHEMRYFRRDLVTIGQIDAFENGASNHLRQGSPAFTTDFRKFLDDRRNLPVAKDRPKILAAIQKHQVIVVSGPTGSGKTTEVPQLAMFNELESCKLVAGTQPRRLAATSVAEFVAKQRDVPVGQEVGYKVRFNNKTTNSKTRLLYMTDGMLVQELKSDALLSKYGCIIIDEAHERSLATDTLFPFLRRALKQRADLKLVIMSATIEAMKFRQYFAQPDGNPAPHLEIGGFSYPVMVYPVETVATITDLSDAVVKTVAMIHTTRAPGDVLVFLEGENEISSVAGQLRAWFPKELNVTPVYSTLSEEEQNKVFETAEKGVRKVVLATNIAETSLTIDGITHVVDTGLVKLLRWNPRFAGESLDTQSISQAAAVQRQGRAGRTAAGECWRLYTVRNYREFMIRSTVPEIKRIDMAPTVLNIMTTMGFKSIKDIWEFDFVDRPDPEQFIRAFEDLRWMGYLYDNGRLVEEAANAAARFPIYPAWYRAIREAEKLGCTRQMVALAAVMSTQASIFTRPKAIRVAADEVHKQFRDPHSDHVSHLNAYYKYCQAEAEGQDMSKWCRENFINQRAASEAIQLEEQFIGICKAMDIQPSDADFFKEEDCTNFRKAIAYGFHHRTAVLTDPGNDAYISSHGQCTGALDPGSGLVGGEYQCIVYNNLRQGPLWYFQTATVIELDWLLDLDYFQVEKIPDFHHRRMSDIKGAVNQALARRAQR